MGTVRVVNSLVELIIETVDGPVEKKTDVSFTQHNVFSLQMSFKNKLFRCLFSFFSWQPRVTCKTCKSQ